MSTERTFGPWLTAESAADYLDFGTTPQAVKNFREFARRRKDRLIPRHRGRTVLFARADLDRVIGETRRPALMKAS